MNRTPETDAFIEMGHGRAYSEFVDFACKLEIERNQWRECAERLAEELTFERECMPKSMRGPQIAMGHFNRLKREITE